MIRIFLLCLVLFISVSNSFSQSEGFRSPVEIKFSPDGKTIAVCDFTKGTVYFIDAGSKTIQNEMKGFNQPFGLAWVAEQKLAVSEYGAHRISFIHSANFHKENSIATVKYPMGIAFGDANQLLVTGFGKGELAVIDLSKQKQTAVVPVWYQPDFVSVSAENKFALLSNLTPM